VSRPVNETAIAALALGVITALAIGGVWWWLGTPITLPPSPLAQGEKLFCVSYAPYRDGQDPLVEGTRVEPEQIDEDLALISKYSNCVRTYSINDGIEGVLTSARRYGLKVLEGLWLYSDPQKSRTQITTTIKLANQFPDVVAAIVIGNEVLLRGDMTATDLIRTIHEVKSQVSAPVTYADVWELWLRYPDVASAVDFVTVHILPYWEDFPIPAANAAAHVDNIYSRVAMAFQNKEVLIGEFGWPSAGRMREGARPSRSNQARAIAETLALARRKNFRINVIEAFDQPWKRWLEGSVGGQWGIFRRATEPLKFSLTGGAVSDHPEWRMQGFAGILLTALTFGSVFLAIRNKPLPAFLWWKITALTLLPAILFGWTIEAVLVESFSPGGWLRSLALAVVAAIAPIVCAIACATSWPLPTFAALLCRTGGQRSTLTWVLGITLIALVLLSVQAALGQVFDPRYRDIDFAPLSAAVVPFLVVFFSTPRQTGSSAVAERVAAWVLVVSAIYIVLNESIANWQAVWLCAALLALAFILARARDAYLASQSPVTI
jgi:exo-beta-1,3-glucanase (GH17 family)